MNLKIKVYLNRVKTNWQNDFARAKEYFKRHNVDVTFDFQDVNVNGYTLYWHTSADRWLIKGSEQLVPINLSYDITVFAFNGAEFTPPRIPTSQCLIPVKQPFINLQTHINDPKDLDYVTICHEIMHAITILASQKEFFIQDQMDTYYNNMMLDSPDSNFGIQWRLLAPFLESFNTMYKPKNFALKELVSPKTLQKYGEKAWEFLDERMLRNLQFLRDNLGAITVNTALLPNRCFDVEFRKEGYSQHNHGRAVDFDVKGMSAEKVRQWMIKNQDRFPEPNMWVEKGTNWVHFDVRYSDKQGVHLFNP